ncbi:hypothetical protein ABMA28_007785 [Loxostege sticticalis]
MKGAGAVKNGPLVSEEWRASDRGPVHTHEAVHTHEEQRNLLSPPRASVASKTPVTSGNLTLSRREHLIAEEIPGPESCV